MLNYFPIYGEYFLPRFFEYFAKCETCYSFHSIKSSIQLIKTTAELSDKDNIEQMECLQKEINKSEEDTPEKRQNSKKLLCCFLPIFNCRRRDLSRMRMSNLFDCSCIKSTKRSNLSGDIPT